MERTFSSTAEVLREEPGILVQKTTHGHGTPILRGLIGKHVLLLYDGIRLNRPTFRMGGNQYLGTIDLSGLDRIEVVRGPSSVMYGSDAMGGVVNLIPAVPPLYDGPMEILPIISTRYSSADNGFSTNLRLSGNYHPLTFASSFAFKNIGDLRGGGSIGRQKPTGWKELNFSGRLAYILNSENIFYFDYLSVRQEKVPRYDKYVSGDFDQYIYDPQDRELYALTFSKTYIGRFIRDLKVNISFGGEHEGRTEQKANSEIAYESTDKLSTYGGYLQLAACLRDKHELIWGVEYYYDRIKSETVRFYESEASPARPTYPDNSKYHSLGIFIHHNWILSNKFRLVSGARFSSIKLISPLESPYGKVEEDYSDITGSLALTVRLSPQINLITCWSRGFYAPNLNDVAVLKTSSSGVDVPSVGLEPENSNNFEIGLKTDSDGYHSSLFAFFNQLSDLIDRKPGLYNGLTFFDENGNGIQEPDEFDVYQRKNVGRAHIYGFEYDGVFEVLPIWEIRSNFFWTRGRNKTDDEPLSRIPPLMGLLAIRYCHRDSNWYELFIRAAGDQRRLSSRDKDDSRIDPDGTPGWMTLNFRMMLGMEKINSVLAVENILDRAYKEHGSGIYSPGINFMISLTFQIL